MKYQFPKFVKLIEDTLVFNEEGSFVFYAPEIYFERKNAEIEGEYVNIIGIMDYAIFDANGKPTSGLKRFILPLKFLTKPSKIEKLKRVQLTKTSGIGDYRLLTYYKNDAIMTSIRLTQDIVNTEDFFKIFKSGKLPTTIPYDRMHELFIEASEHNNIGFGLSLQLFGVIVSEYCRNPNNLREPFRLTSMNSMTGYKALNLVDIPKYITPYSSLISENWDSAIIGAIVNDKGPKSPMERMLMETGSNLD